MHGTHRPQAMDRSFVALALGVTLLALAAVPAEARKKKEEEPQKSEDLPGTAEKMEGFEAREGFFKFYVDDREGKIWLEVPAPEGERGEAARLIYVEGLLSGLGSNPVGLDRGQISDASLLVVRRVGRRVLFEQPNLRYRALSDDPAEQRATRESFATSVLWAGDAAALDPDGRTLIDFTSFLLRDAHDVVQTLRESEQGTWRLDEGRSAVDPVPK